MTPRSHLLPCVFLALAFLPACGDNLGPSDPDGSAGADAGTDGTGGDDGGLVAPRVISTLPVLLGIDVPAGTVVTATFSKPMNATTLTDVTFTLDQGAASIDGEVTFDEVSATATFTPDADLVGDRTYTGTITTGARDTSGLAMAADHVWTFSTSDDSLPPVVLSTNPAADALDVSVSKRPSATFSKAMNPASLTDLTFTLRQGLNSITGTVVARRRHQHRHLPAVGGAGRRAHLPGDRHQRRPRHRRHRDGRRPRLGLHHRGVQPGAGRPRRRRRLRGARAARR